MLCPSFSSRHSLFIENLSNFKPVYDQWGIRGHMPSGEVSSGWIAKLAPVVSYSFRRILLRVDSQACTGYFIFLQENSPHGGYSFRRIVLRVDSQACTSCLLLPVPCYSLLYIQLSFAHLREAAKK